MAFGRLVSERDGLVETLVPRVDLVRVERTSEAEIAAEEAEDEAEAKAAAAAYARRVRLRTGLAQATFAARIGVPLDTVRNWEQGKRAPAGPARALLRILDRAPQAALAALKESGAVWRLVDLVCCARSSAVP
jgi:putative transcriptional regulator